MEPSSGDTETSFGLKIHSNVTPKPDLEQVKRQKKVEHTDKYKTIMQCSCNA
ncbi:hypothetical protein DPMN_076645 [Dreissena polymorpha]|uniref:Uncharacterized protein n=1 Tax=Dreissena polymorpha TaxID=45954 RepID=A0A9D4BFY0_DREPO|nr:hypothetical protein DPMN_076645 [Dreissena polymorpha]